MGKELIDAFYHPDVNGRLLIIGEPGSGKTTLLIQLALEFIEKEEGKIPIILDIATWKEEFRTVEEWMEELLPYEGFSKAAAKSLVAEKQILPLFDGLDELQKDLRDAFLEAVTKYSAQNEVKYVICSRVDEYEEVIDAPANYQIKVELLTKEQIFNNLQNSTWAEKNGLLNAIEQDEILSEAILVPFYLNTVQLLFAERKILSDFNFQAEDVSGRQDEITDRFVEAALVNMTDQYESGDNKKWLSFLANRMELFSLAQFELTDLQGNWVLWKNKEVFQSSAVWGVVAFVEFGISSAIFLGLILAISLMSAFIPVAAILSGFKMFLYITAALVLLVMLTSVWDSFYNVLPYPLIDTKEILVWSYGKVLKSINDNMVSSMVTGFIISYHLGGNIITKAIYFFIIVFILAVSFGLWDFFAYSNKNYIKINHPFKRFQVSRYRLWFSEIQHYFLKWQLKKKGLLPYDIVSFLHAGTQQYLFESNGKDGQPGGYWRFRHRIIRTYFLDHWAAHYAEAFPTARQAEASKATEGEEE